MALEVRLVNMPFWQAAMPSISLTQLKSRCDDVLGPAVSTRIEYVVHDFAKLFGPERYERMAHDSSVMHSGFGDWIFRPIAFPKMADNTADYLGRYGRMVGEDLIDNCAEGGLFSRGTLLQTLNAIIDQRQLDRADVVGFTSTFVQTVPSLAMARLLRERNPRQVLVMGGSNCEGVMGRALSEVLEDVDFLFSGPGLVSFPEFLKRLQVGDGSTARDVDGVITCARSRFHDSSETSAGKVDFGAELDIATPVALNYEDFMVSFDGVPDPKDEATLPFETSRGCWWGQMAHCTFCGLNGETMAYRAMPTNMAQGLISSLLDRYPNVRKFLAVDSILPRDYTAGVFSNMTASRDIEIFYETKADLLDDDVRTLSKAGVTRIQPGVESLITTTLKVMRKGTTAFHNIRLLKSCLRHRVGVEWNLLVGFPGETPDTFDLYNEMLPKLYHLTPPSGIFPIRFDRFSPYHSTPEKYDLELIPASHYEYCYPFPEDVIERTAYFFQNVNITSSYFEPLIAGLKGSEEVVARWQALWRRLAGRPRLELHCQAGAWQLLDSRSGTETIVSLDAETLLLLARFGEVADIGPLAEAGSGPLQTLRRLGLLFEERGRAIALVDTGAITHLAESPSGAVTDRAVRRQAIPSGAHA